MKKGVEYQCAFIAIALEARKTVYNYFCIAPS